jgi:hypothetical protein
MAAPPGLRSPLMAVQHVGEGTMQPGFAGSIVVATVNAFIEHVGAISAQP